MAPSSQSSNRSLSRGQPSYTPLSRYRELQSPFGLMSRWMDDMERALLGGSARTGRLDSPLWNPQVEAFERGDQLVVRADLPGVPDDQVSVQVEGDVLTISGHRSDDRSEEHDGYYHSERSYGSFQRSIALPPGIDPDAIAASFEHGVLEVTLPKPPARPSGKKIGIGKPGAQSRQAVEAPATAGKPS